MTDRKAKQRDYNRTSAARISTGAVAGSPLSPREKAVVALLRGGVSNDEAARQLALSEGSVKTIIHRAYRKLGVTDRAGLMRLRRQL